MTDGDTLTVASGTVAWDSDVTILNKCITITGAGNSAGGTKLTYSGAGTHYFFVVNNTGKNCASNPVNISGFWLSKTGGPQVQGYVRIFGVWIAGQFRVHDNRFENTARAANPDSGVYVNGTLGVIDSNVFQGDMFGTIVYGRFETDWNAYATFAMGGATGGAGGNAVFIEANTFNFLSTCYNGSNIGFAAVDFYAGGHIVFRYNTLINSFMETHEISRSGQGFSGFLHEEYGNVFSNACPSGGMWKAFDIASGTGANFLNTFNSPVQFGVGLIDYRTEAVLPLGAGSGGICNGSQPIDQNTAGQTGWRCYGQIGSAGLAGNAVSWSYHSFGNICNSTCGSTNAAVHDFTPNPGGQVSSVHIQANRDYEIGTTGTAPPGTCSVGDVFWETDAGEWNSTNGATADGRSWVCTSVNMWTLRYGAMASNTTGLPYEYPHPLRTGGGGGGGDTTAPTLNITSPASNFETTASTVDIAGTCTDDTACGATVSYTSTAGNGNATGTESWSLSAAAIDEGVNQFVFSNTDAAMNTGTATLNLLRRSCTGLPYTETYTGSAWATTGPCYQQLGTGTRNSIASNVAQANGNGGPYVEAYIGETLSADHTIKATVTTTAQGTREWRMCVRASGTTGQSNDLYAIFLQLDVTGGFNLLGRYNGPSGFDTVLQSFSGFTITPGTTTGRLEVQGSSVKAYIDEDGPGGGAEVQIGTTYTIPSGFATGTAGPCPWGDGTQWDNVVIDNVGSPSDTTAPAVAIDTPTATTTQTVDATIAELSGTATDAVGVTACSYENNVSPGAVSMMLSMGDFSAADVPLLIGANVITVTCLDAAGNPGTDVITVIREVVVPPTSGRPKGRRWRVVP